MFSFFRVLLFDRCVRGVHRFTTTFSHSVVIPYVGSRAPRRNICTFASYHCVSDGTEKNVKCSLLRLIPSTATREGHTWIKFIVDTATMRRRRRRRDALRGKKTSNRSTRDVISYRSIESGCERWLLCLGRFQCTEPNVSPTWSRLSRLPCHRRVCFERQVPSSKSVHQAVLSALLFASAQYSNKRGTRRCRHQDGLVPFNHTPNRKFILNRT